MLLLTLRKTRIKHAALFFRLSVGIFFKAVFASYPTVLDMSQPLSGILSTVFCFAMKEWKAFSDIQNFWCKERGVIIQGSDLTEGSNQVKK